MTKKGLCVLFVLSFLFTIQFHSTLAQEDDEAFLDIIEYQAFLFFYENTDERGFTIESTAWPIGSSAASGFYLTSVPIAIERGWINYDEGYQRSLETLNSYYDDFDDLDDFFVESEHGFFPHWFDQETGEWSEVDCFSSIDTAILMAGVLTVRQYFADTEVEDVATKLYEDVDWEWMLNGDDTLSMGWRPDTGFISTKWEGYNEGMLAVLLAMGSPTHPISEECWDAWARTYKQVEHQHGNQSYKFIESTSTSLFTYQYPHIWFDFRDKTDKFGINYFQNSINATLENRAYCIENPEAHKGYGPNVWGLTASECPLHESNYGAHGPRQNDDGTVAPSGAGGSIIFTPHESVEALRYIKENYGYGLWGKYGFKDAFNLDIDWFSPTYICIDQGAILTAAENYRSGLIQSLFMQNSCAKIALHTAGFTDADTTTPPTTLPTEFKTYETPAPGQEDVTLPSEAPYDSLLVDKFDDCISRYGAGAWHGGSSTPEDCVIMFDHSNNRGETGCSMKIRYNVEKKGSYNGAWIKLPSLDLIHYNELVFWVKGDKEEGYTTSFKIELKSKKGKVEYVTKDLTSSWGRTVISLDEFITPAGAYKIDWGNVNELTLVFEDWRVTDKNGVVYIDDIYFTQATSKPTPTPILSTHFELDSDGDGWSDEKESLMETDPYSVDSDNDGINDPQDPNPTVPDGRVPGFRAVLATAELLAVAYLLRRRKRNSNWIAS